jgi:DNA-packaging protein gp3
MAATKGNQWWKLRSKHGRDKIFQTPEAMWDAAAEYFQWCDENPLIEIDFRGKDSDQVQLPRMRAYTMIGACHRMDVCEAYFNAFEARIKEKTDKTSKDFVAVITRIREVVRQQKFEGAAAGFLNPTIISRDLGLKDSQEISLSGSISTTTTYVLKRRK